MYSHKQPKDIRCPLEYAIELFGGRWKSRVLCMLYKAPALRYGEIKKHLEGVTDTMLASTLKDMIADGLIERHQYPEIPPRVEYCLTEKGRSLVPFLRSICRWAGSFHNPEEQESLRMQHCKECAVHLTPDSDESPEPPEMAETAESIPAAGP